MHFQRVSDGFLRDGCGWEGWTSQRETGVSRDHHFQRQFSVHLRLTSPRRGSGRRRIPGARGLLELLAVKRVVEIADELRLEVRLVAFPASRQNSGARDCQFVGRERHAPDGRDLSAARQVLAAKANVIDDLNFRIRLYKGKQRACCRRAGNEGNPTTWHHRCMAIIDSYNHP
jgi:hypothetical protein